MSIMPTLCVRVFNISVRQNIGRGKVLGSCPGEDNLLHCNYKCLVLKNRNLDQNSTNFQICSPLFVFSFFF